MSQIAASPPSAGPRDRLQAYSRLLQVIEEQTEALERDDDARLCELGEQRRRLEEELQGDGEEQDGTTALHRELKLLVDERREALEQRLSSKQELREFWIRLRDEALSSARSMRIRPATPGCYREMPLLETRLDVRF